MSETDIVSNEKYGDVVTNIIKSVDGMALVFGIGALSAAMSLIIANGYFIGFKDLSDDEIKKKIDALVDSYSGLVKRRAFELFVDAKSGKSNK